MTFNFKISTSSKSRFRSQHSRSFLCLHRELLQKLCDILLLDESQLLLALLHLLLSLLFKRRVSFSLCLIWDGLLTTKEFLFAPKFSEVVLYHGNISLFLLNLKTNFCRATPRTLQLFGRRLQAFARLSNTVAELRKLISLYL